MPETTNNAQEELTDEQIPTVEDIIEPEEEISAEKINELNDNLVEMTVEAQKQKEFAIRTMADMENLKRRSRIDVENAHKYGLEKFVNALIPVIDSMEMGLNASKEEGATIKSLQEGFDMTFKQTLDMLNDFSVERINPIGEKFDPKTQEAMTMVPSEEHESNIVIDVIQKGYVLNERLVRAARVIVAK